MFTVTLRFACQEQTGDLEIKRFSFCCRPLVLRVQYDSNNNVLLIS
jgi:hypothetical protein